ncbi:UNVERIFIED_CONTAM: hypothetical protein K2H54_017172 [Gekko kuhli]
MAGLKSGRGSRTLLKVEARLDHSFYRCGCKLREDYEQRAAHFGGTGKEARLGGGDMSKQLRQISSVVMEGGGFHKETRKVCAPSPFQSWRRAITREVLSKRRPEKYERGSTGGKKTKHKCQQITPMAESALGLLNPFYS